MGKKWKNLNLDHFANEIMVWCKCCECEIPNKKSCLDEHYKVGSKHSRKKKLLLFQSLFLKERLDYFSGGTIYYCQKCKI